MKADAALGPFLKFTEHIFGDQNHVGGAADEFVFGGVGLGNNQSENSRAIRRGYGHEAFTGLELGIVGEMETKLINEKTDAAVVVAHEDVDALDAQMGRHGTRGHGEIIKR